MKAHFAATTVCAVAALIFGKWILPLLEQLQPMSAAEHQAMVSWTRLGADVKRDGPHVTSLCLTIVEDGDVTDRHLDALAEFSKLRVLHLTETFSRDCALDAIAHLDALKRLWLEDWKFDRNRARRLAQHRQLKELLLLYSRFDDGALAELAGLENLEVLMLQWCEFAPEDQHVFGKLPKLKRLRAFETPLTDEALRALPPGQLTELQCAGSKVTEAGLRAFREANPNCQVD